MTSATTKAPRPEGKPARKLSYGTVNLLGALAASPSDWIEYRHDRRQTGAGLALHSDRTGQPVRAVLHRQKMALQECGFIAPRHGARGGHQWFITEAGLEFDAKRLRQARVQFAHRPHYSPAAIAASAASAVSNDSSDGGAR